MYDDEEFVTSAQLDRWIEHASNEREKIRAEMKRRGIPIVMDAYRPKPRTFLQEQVKNIWHK